MSIIPLAAVAEDLEIKEGGGGLEGSKRRKFAKKQMQEQNC
jgi:hypothetical protein